MTKRFKLKQDDTVIYNQPIIYDTHNGESYFFSSKTNIKDLKNIIDILNNITGEKEDDIKY